MSNRLRDETSPYLQQHADNPVEWHPWDDTALELARSEQRPILLSIGYSACHWCHVMAHECFEDPATAAVMNRLFVNVKVDREERPDIDRIYQTSHQLMAGRGGGWPLTAFLTPDEHLPIFIGTWGPKMCQLAGELARETKSDGLWDPDYVSIIRENLDIGARRAGRQPAEVGICAGPLCSISADRVAAFAAARRVLAVYLPYLHPMTEVAGIPADEILKVREAAAAGDFEKGASYVSDLAVQKHSVTGTPDDVIPQIEKMISAGVTHVAFGHPLGPSFEEAVDLIGREILPHFAKQA